MGRKIFWIVVSICLSVGITMGLIQISKTDTPVEHSASDTTTMIVIHEQYASVDEMNTAFATDDVPEGGYVLINSNVDDPDNASVYMKGAEGYEFVCDLSGAKGADGANGVDGVTPLLRISSDTGMWEVSYTAGTSWTSTGVTAQGPQGEQGEQGPQGDKGDTGARGPQGATGATGATGPAYVLTEADKQAIINAVLAQIGNGGNEGSGSDTDTVMFEWNEDSLDYHSCSTPSTAYAYQHTCEQCGAVLYGPSAPMYCPNGNACSNIDGYFTTDSNPYYEGSSSGTAEYYATSADGPWEQGRGDYASYYCETSCGATLYVQDSIMSYVMTCPHCYESHDVMWSG